MIAFTGVSINDREVLAAGFADLLIKPVTPTRLVTAIVRAAGRPQPD